MKIECAINVDWARSKHDMRSISGFCVFVGGKSSILDLFQTTLIDFARKWAFNGIRKLELHLNKMDLLRG